MDLKAYVSNEIDRKSLESLIQDYKFGRYCEDQSLPLDSSQRLVFDRVLFQLKQTDTKAIVVCSSSGQLLGILVFRLSQWDTDHFGYKVVIIDTLLIRKSGYQQESEVADLLLANFLNWCESSSVRFVSVRVPALDLPAIHALEHCGFQYIENWIFNKYDLNRIDDHPDPHLELRLARPDDCGIMIDASREAFSTQRFHADHHIPHEKADTLYEKWILTSFNDPGQEILVLDIGYKPAAFMIYYKSDLRNYFGLQFAMWKMALLNPENRSKGLGTDFFLALIHHHRRNGLDVIDSGLTTRNLASLNLHIKLNFKVTSSVVTFHKWFG